MNGGASISRRNDETDDIAQTRTEILGYGKQSASRTLPSTPPWAAVTRKDMVMAQTAHNPDNIIFGVVATFD